MKTAAIVALVLVGLSVPVALFWGAFIHAGSQHDPPAPSAEGRWQCAGCGRTYIYPERPEYFDFDADGTYRAWCCRNCIVRPARAANRE